MYIILRYISNIYAHIQFFFTAKDQKVEATDFESKTVLGEEFSPKFQKFPFTIKSIVKSSVC